MCAACACPQILTNSGQLFNAIGILGAMCMPHNIFLGSASRCPTPPPSIRRLSSSLAHVAAPGPKATLLFTLIFSGPSIAEVL